MKLIMVFSFSSL